MATETENHATAQKIIALRARRTGQSVASLTKDVGWLHVANSEINEAKTRHNNILLGGTDLLEVLEEDAIQAEQQRSAA